MLPDPNSVREGLWQGITYGLGSSFLLYVLVGLLAPMRLVRRFFGAD